MTREQDLIEEAYLRDLERERRDRHTPTRRWMRPTRMSCGHELVMYADEPDWTATHCPHCRRMVFVKRDAS